MPLSPVMRTPTLVVAMRLAYVISSRMLAADDRVPVLERDVVDRPEREALLALGPRALDFVDG